VSPAAGAGGAPDLSALSAAEVADRVASGALAPEAAVDAAFARADAVDAGRGGLNAVLHSDREAARADARAVAGRRGKAPLPLAGVPVAVKDNIATLGLPTTCGSRILEGYVSPFEATVIARLRAAGAVIAAKTNMDEFAMGSSTEHSAYGPTRNPVDRARVPGGSSGGSAAAVACGMVRVALGSETGGSVRQPASFCGVVGVKPTYGRVSRYGLVAFASSLDQVGVFGRTVDDAALGLQVIAGLDPRDATSADVPVPAYREAAAVPLKGMVIGKPKEYYPPTLDAGIRARCEEALEALKALGAEVRDVSLPHTSLAIPVYYIVAPAEASSNLARFDGVRYGLRVAGGDGGLRGMYEATRSRGFGAEVTRRILLGTYVLSAGYYDAYYKKAMDVRALITDDFRAVFASGVHVLFTPTTPTPAFEIGAISDPYEMYLSDIFTATANLAGNPAMSVPVGQVRTLPVGGQIIAPHFEEYRMFGVAYALERALGGVGAGAGAHR
jgi:aspartyl-tRNA(Asn)/glutamyl-tRNA(Gln) amidotransferase subunit A